MCGSRVKVHVNHDFRKGGNLQLQANTCNLEGMDFGETENKICLHDKMTVLTIEKPLI